MENEVLVKLKRLTFISESLTQLLLLLLESLKGFLELPLLVQRQAMAQTCLGLVRILAISVSIPAADLSQAACISEGRVFGLGALLGQSCADCIFWSFFLSLEDEGEAFEV
jgi:hypothetical protein